MPFRITGPPAETFRNLFAKSDQELAAIGMKRCVADSDTGYPCRVSLQDASVGETLILGPYEHHPSDGPYRALGPIFVRENATECYDSVDEVPQQLLIRQLSVRAYDRDGLMREADVVEGHELAAVLERFFDEAAIDYIHIHNARPGCFACRVDRTG